LRGDLVLKNRPGKKIIVDPLTLENLRATGIDLDSVDWVVLIGEPCDAPK
jgi:hypothetical protein